MSRKQKIIVSVTGIFIVLLILVGLTYAYFLTQISGNTNSKSISVTTANLVLDYGEETSEIKGITNAEPGYSVTKTFTATNNGNSEVDYVAVLESVTNELTRQQDLVYTLECKSYLKTGFSLSSDGTVAGTINGTCNGVEETQFPSTTDVSIMVRNKIAITQVHVYKLVVTYKEAGVDQSDDMNKTFSAKINIRDSRNPYGSNTFAGTLIKNSIGVSDSDNSLGYAKFRANPLTVPAKSRSRILESTLSITEDNYGISYYYRGNVTNNYINFAGKCFRIVRVAGDGSVKLILEDNNVTCNSSSYTGNWNIGSSIYGSGIGEIFEQDNVNWSSSIADYYDNNGLKAKIDDWYNKNLNSYQSKLKQENVCLGDITTKYNIKDTELYGNKTQNFEYDTYHRLSSRESASLKCNGVKATSSYAYPITADEVAFAGAVDNDYNQSFYLYNSYQVDNELSFWTVSLTLRLMESGHYGDGIGDYAYRVSKNGALVTYFNSVYVSGVATSYNARPMITLKSGTTFASGDGTRTNPYVVN